MVLGGEKRSLKIITNVQKADDAAFLLKCGVAQSFNRTEIEHGTIGAKTFPGSRCLSRSVVRRTEIKQGSFVDLLLSAVHQYFHSFVINVDVR